MDKIVKQSFIFLIGFIVLMAFMKWLLGKEVNVSILWQGILTASLYGLFLYLDKRHEDKKKN